MTTLSQSKIRRNVLYFNRNFMTNRSFRVVCGGAMSEKKGIENGVVQAAVISVTLVALSKMPRMIRLPVKLIGYADDWEIYTKDQDMSIAQNNMQEALKTIADWMKNSGFQISINKTVVM
jgi:hypothetical protein